MANRSVKCGLLGLSAVVAAGLLVLAGRPVVLAMQVSRAILDCTVLWLARLRPTSGAGVGDVGRQTTVSYPATASMRAITASLAFFAFSTSAA